MHHTVPYTMYNMFNRFATFDLLSTLGMALVRVVMWSGGLMVKRSRGCGHVVIWMWSVGYVDQHMVTLVTRPDTQLPKTRAGGHGQ